MSTLVNSSSSSSEGFHSGESQGFRKCLTMAIGALLMEKGIDSIEPLAMQTLTEILQAFVTELGRNTHNYTELALRQTPLPADILLALVEMGVSIEGLHSFIFRPGRRSLSNPGILHPSRPTTILHTGDRRKHRPNSVVPEHFTEFPDSHSYIRTPTHKQPVTDYKAVREKAASQKRDVERALTRFIAKTGKTHSLFNVNDTNLFPLISCDRTMPDQPILPSYVNALIFKDQLFEEDERDFLPKKKRGAEENKEENDNENLSGDEDEKDENSETNTSLSNDKDDKKKDESFNEVVVENPFLKPARTPKTPIKRIL